MLDGTLAELPWNQQSDSRLAVFGGQSLLLAVNHEHPALSHDVVELVGHHLVERMHGLGRDPGLRRSLFKHSVDVGLESRFVVACPRLLLSLFPLFK